MLSINQKGIPNTPGVYIFLKNKKPLYVGKASNLGKRLASYFRKDQSLKTSQLLKESNRLKLIKTESEIDALIKEAELIKKYLPKYNIVMRDDKSYFYIAITREKFPKIYITHQPGQMLNVKGQMSEFIGPFTSGLALKATLRLLRRVFPYCTCKKPHKRPCLNSQIGRCLGYCCLKPIQNAADNSAPIKHSNILENVGMSAIAKKNYKENIRSIIAVLNGRKKKLLTDLKKTMRAMVKKQEFENAAKIRDQILGLENIFRHSFLFRPALRYGDVLKWTRIEKNIKKILRTQKNISRVEGYDISNISGKEATGSMVVFIDGEPAKSEYRKFKIKTVRQISDVDMIKEVLSRRFKHSEWPMPDLILIDGGKPQLNAALTALNSQFLKFAPSANSRALPVESQAVGFRLNFQKPKVTALAKREEELYIENKQKPIKLNSLPQETAFFFQKVRDESHRFAKKYHHQLRKSAFKI